MLVVIGVTKDDKNKMNKTYEVKKEVNCKLKESTSIISPILILQKINISDLADINYIYIADFKRYYFVDNINMGLGGCVELVCSIDALMSHKEEILEIRGTVKRAQFLKNGYIVDDKYKSVSYSQIVTRRFPNAMDNDSFILMTVG